MIKVLLFSFISFLSFGQDIRPACSVSLRVVNYEGKSEPYQLVSFFDELGNDYSSQFNLLSGQVPCAVRPYVFKVSRIGVDHRLAVIEGRISASNPENWLTIVPSPNIVFSDDGGVASLARIVPPGYVWNGFIPQTSKERLWVSIRSAVGLDRIEAGVDSNGAFRFYTGLLNGPYVLSVLNESGEVVYTTALKVTSFAPREPLVIDLSSSAPHVIVVK